MCLAAPMKVIEIQGEGETALVERDGVRQTIYLGIVDAMPQIGDYVIIHAGFAIRTLSEEDALENIRLISQLDEAAIF